MKNRLVGDWQSKYDEQTKKLRRRPRRRSRRSNSERFSNWTKADSSIPSKSGLDVLNCRTFVEGLRLTVVQGDIATCSGVSSDSNDYVDEMICNSEKTTTTTNTNDIAPASDSSRRAYYYPNKVPTTINESTHWDCQQRSINSADATADDSTDTCISTDSLSTGNDDVQRQRRGEEEEEENEASTRGPIQPSNRIAWYTRVANILVPFGIIYFSSVYNLHGV